MRTRIFVEAAKLKKEEEEEKRKKEREEKKGGRRTAGRGPREEDKVDARHYLAEIRSSFQVFLLSLSLSLSLSLPWTSTISPGSREYRESGERRGEERRGEDRPRRRNTAATLSNQGRKTKRRGGERKSREKLADRSLRVVDRSSSPTRRKKESEEGVGERGPGLSSGRGELLSLVRRLAIIRKNGKKKGRGKKRKRGDDTPKRRERERSEERAACVYRRMVVVGCV